MTRQIDHDTHEAGETQPAPPSIEPPDGLHDTFADHVQTDSTVCNNCFRLVATEQTGRHSIGELGWFIIRYRNAIDETTVPAAPVRVTKGTVRACDCGEYRTHHKRRPLDKDRAMRYAENLSVTLRLKRIPHDPEVLLSDVNARISEPDTSGREDGHVFAPAVARSVAVAATRLRTEDTRQAGQA